MGYIGSNGGGGGASIASGSGTTNALTRFNASDELEDSGVSDNGTTIALARKVTIAIVDAADIGLTVTGAAAQSGNYLNVTANGGAAGGVFKIDSSGNVGVSGIITVSGSGKYIAWGDTQFGDILANGRAIIGYNSGTGFDIRDNAGNLVSRINGTTRTWANFKGADVASAAAIVPTGNLFHVTGTTNITSITATNIYAGTEIAIIFDGVLTFTDGSNLKLAGNFVTAADSTIKLVYDGTNWYELSRSTN